jgi:hypothetical protein
MLDDQEQQKNIMQTHLSILVRARMLFKREVEIDRAMPKRRFAHEYLIHVVEMKKLVDLQMQKLLATSAACTLIFYLLGKGMRPELSFLGLNLANIPGVLIFISLFCAYSLAMATFAFYNSQSYAALIDQIILEDAQNGLLDVDMIKASYEPEWLIFKSLRRDFSFYAPVHIKYRRTGHIFSAATFLSMTFVAVIPFIALIATVPYLAVVFLENDFFGIVTKCFIFLCSLSTFLLVIVCTIGFKCDVSLNSNQAADTEA